MIEIKDIIKRHLDESESDNSRYVQFSFQYLSHQSITINFYIWIYFSFAFASLILLHSFFINGKKMHFVRVATDIACILSILLSIFMLIAIQNPNPTKSAVMVNFFSIGLFLSGTQLCDGYVFYNRLKAVKNLSYFTRMCIHFYINIILILPAMLPFTILPLFVDVSSDNAYNIIFISFEIQLALTIIYNVYFTFEFGRIFYQLYFGGSTLASGLFFMYVFHVCF